MRKHFALLFILLALATGIAGAASAEQAVEGYLAPGEYYYLEEVNYSNSTYYICYISARETFVLEPVASGYGITTSQGIIYSVLMQKELSELEVGGDVSELRGNLEEFNAQRAHREEECEHLTGTNANPCYDTDSCFYACFSVPSCRAVNQGSGGELVDEILAWRIEDEKIEGNLTAYEGHLDDIEAMTENVLIDLNSAESKLNAIENPVSTIQASRIFNPGGPECPLCFGYCYAINYNMTLINESKSIIAGMRSSLSALDTAELTSRSEAILQETQQREDMKAYFEMIDEVHEKEANLTARGNELLQYFTDSELSQDLQELSGTKKQMQNLAAAGDYSSAISLNSTFWDQAAAVETRLAELEQQYSQFISLISSVDSREASINETWANLSQSIESPETEESLGQLWNISKRIREHGLSAEFEEAAELQDDFSYRADALESRMGIMQSGLEEMAGAQESAWSALQETKSALRQGDTNLTLEYNALETEFNQTLAKTTPKVNASTISNLTQDFSGAEASATQLSEKIAEEHKKEDWKAVKSYAYSAYEVIFGPLFNMIK